MVNGIVSLISHSDLSLLVHRNARYFCALILYPATLPNLLISSSSFPVFSLGFSMYSIMSSANSDNFYFFLSNLYSFYFFFFSAVARTSKLQTILQSYSNQDNMVLAQKQKYRSLEQERKPRDKPTHLWSTNL